MHLLKILLPRAVALCACAALSLGGTGCISTAYKMAKKESPPVVLNLPAEHAELSGAVQTVIVQKGPGSWKREAWWDEYIVAVTNRSTAPLTLTEAALFDFQDRVVSPGDNPWVLERETQSWWKQTRGSQTAALIVIGAGTVVGAGLVYGAALGSLMGGAASVGAGAGAASVAVVALPVYAIAVVFINANNKSDVLAEFERRRLPLPLALAPGETRAGSFFFRVSPGPKKLILRTSGNASLTFDLAPLADLHLKKPAAKAAAPSSPPP